MTIKIKRCIFIVVIIILIFITMLFNLTSLCLFGGNMSDYKLFQGKLVLKTAKVAVVLSRFNDFIGEKLLSGAVDCLNRHGLSSENVSVYKVPGSFEIPGIASKLAKTGNFDGIVCLGAVIRGSTPHFDYVAAEVSKGVASVSMASDIPVVFGVLTTDTIEQAIERAGTKSGNKGADAALALIEMINLYKEIK